MYKLTAFIFALITNCIICPTIYADSTANFNLLTASKQQLPQAVKITIDKDPVYGTTKHYLAYPLTDILKPLIKEFRQPFSEKLIVFTAADGYKVTMSYLDAQLNSGFIAFKDLSSDTVDWLPFKFGVKDITPAPFYLVWPDSKLDKWRYPSPFQLTSISILTVSKYYSAAAPDTKNTKTAEGFNLYSRYCIRCHSINNTGGKLGPELAGEKNITDYLSSSQLNQIILDAPLIRPNTKMPSFKHILEKKDAIKLQQYIKSMKHKTQTP